MIGAARQIPARVGDSQAILGTLLDPTYLYLLLVT
jgi:hypothetical protein